MRGEGTDSADKKIASDYFRQAYISMRNTIANASFFFDLEGGKDSEYLYYYGKVSKEDAYKEFLLAKMYLNGEGIEKDCKKAYMAFQLSSANGYEPADYYIEKIESLNASDTYGKAENSHPAEENIQSADEHSEKSPNENVDNEYKSVAQQNEKIEELNASDTYSKAENSNTDEENFQSAEKYSEKVLNEYIESFKSKPNGSTACKIGDMYNFWQGSRANINEAIKWYQKAVELGNEQAKEKLQKAIEIRGSTTVAIASLVTHMGKIIQNETIKSVEQRYSSDKKVLRREKINKIYSRQAADDKQQSYDY